MKITNYNISIDLPVQRAVIANSRHHYDSVSSQFPDLVHKRVVHKVWPAYAEVQDTNAFEYCIIERIQKP